MPFGHRSAPHYLFKSAGRGDRNLNLVRHNSKYFFYYLLVFLLLPYGCTSVAKETKASHLAKVTIGESTKDDVLIALGLPNKIETKILHDNEKLEFWIYYKGSLTTSVMFPVTIVPSGNFIVAFLSDFQVQDIKNIAAIIAFNKQGLVVEVKSGEDR